MNKAFIFDMDGVIINSENVWVKYEKKFYPQLFGKKIAEKVGNTTGIGLDAIYEKAVSFGFTMNKHEYLNSWNQIAKKVYKEAEITRGLDTLINLLTTQKFKLGLVSASPLLWMNWTLDKLPFKNVFNEILSLHERDDLAHKPEPDGYLEAMKVLGAEPKDTIILEDSNAGIASGKAAGAFVIGLQENLVPGYKQTGADVYAKDINEVIEIVQGERH